MKTMMIKAQKHMIMFLICPMLKEPSHNNIKNLNQIEIIKE
jgi:hypothetical protein